MGAFTSAVNNPSCPSGAEILIESSMKRGAQKASPRANVIEKAMVVAYVGFTNSQAQPKHMIVMPAITVSMRGRFEK